MNATFVRETKGNGLSKVDDELTVLWIAGLHECLRSLDHFQLPGGHAGAMIDDQPGGYGNIFIAKQGDGLRTAIFLNFKVCFLQSGYETALVVSHDDRQSDQVDFLGDGVRRMGFLVPDYPPRSRE